MSEKRVGRLGYNVDNNRYGVLMMDLWEIEGLHCGTTFEVWIDGEWKSERIEMSDSWYLVHSNLKGEELEGLRIRI